MKFKLALICTLALAAGQALACYTVYDRGNRVLYQGEQPPVDMSRPLHETLQRRHPGATLVFEQGTACGAVRAAQLLPAAGQPQPPDTRVLGAAPAQAPRGGRVAPAARMVEPASPLLTDRRTAQAMRVPYTPLGGGVVVVPPESAGRLARPGVTVVPGEPAPRASLVSAAPVVTAPREQVVITEMREPPVTIVQRGSELYLSN